MLPQLGLETPVLGVGGAAGRVPAIGREITRPSRSCTMGSGEEPTIVTAGWRRKYMYGLGLTWRRTR